MSLFSIPLAFSMVASPAADLGAVKVAHAGDKPSAAGPADYFTGRVRIDAPFSGRTAGTVLGGATVSFEPGARTAWHTHPLGQTLIVTNRCRLGAGMGQTGAGTEAGRHRLDSAGRQALARRACRGGDEPHCDRRIGRRLAGHLDGASVRTAVRPGHALTRGSGLNLPGPGPCIATALSPVRKRARSPPRPPLPDRNATLASLLPPPRPARRLRRLPTIGRWPFPQHHPQASQRARARRQGDVGLLLQQAKEHRPRRAHPGTTAYPGRTRRSARPQPVPARPFDPAAEAARPMVADRPGVPLRASPFRWFGPKRFHAPRRSRWKTCRQSAASSSPMTTTTTSTATPSEHSPRKRNCSSPRSVSATAWSTGACRRPTCASSTGGNTPKSTACA